MTQNTQPEITSITYKPQQVDFTPPDRYSRIPLDQANLLEDYGIEGDRKGGNPKRNLNLLFAEVVEELTAEGHLTEPGAFGEQMIIRGLNATEIKEGTLLKLGSGAVLEVISWRTGCDRLERIQGVEKERLQGRLGVMAKVIRGGLVRVGDAVRVLEPDEVHV
jgi:molybdopterin adenylyltransferase